MPQSAQGEKAVANDEIMRRVLEALARSSPEPLKTKDVASAAKVSANTAGKYVDIAVANGLVATRPYGPVRQCWITEEGKRWLTRNGVPAETKGGRVK